MKKKVKQDCPLSSTLFNLFLKDIDEEWERRKEEGTVIGNQRIFRLKFADDIAMVAKSTIGMREMIKALEDYKDRNDLEVNIDRTKIMIFRRGGRKRKREKWYLDERRIEIVNNYKYLGFWFTTKNTHRRHIKVQARSKNDKRNVGLPS